ncbi:fibrinogen C domain-containing protein 1-B-like [Strongylocentrotus purpuratus]|uniref:Fibrinogen C-terminal domain-containing protein n=1 Tax=Strongylocentrotus purpuratus TaxID=7668 RepID=A0A7M7LT17_STRPU|nr:fibrinogen C domain-containing protein 1-B-like [Strongylocentrotus purpuratus]|eukprot:XP_011668937.1 PREDICTED: fibrinogen C domain-containing protein 1-B-like [Strongylocentrotus purpuratus]
MLHSMGYQTSGVYSIIPSGADAIDVYCDMISDGGGWTVFQKRYDGSVNFYRNYAEYVQGFGDVSGEYWLGLDIIYLLAKDGVELRIDMVDYSNNQVYAHYSQFSIGSPITNYRVTFSSYSGTAGEGLNAANAQGFTTYDLDNDNLAGNCAVDYQGAWWYQSCYTSNLNGVYGIQNELRGIVWNWPEPKYMTSTEMKLRESS